MYLKYKTKLALDSSFQTHIKKKKHFNCLEHSIYCLVNKRTFLYYIFRSIISECLASFFYVFIVCGAAAGAGIGARYVIIINIFLHILKNFINK